ncbi:hypothetical protein Tco_0189019 [Tanacetum coccineum]
MVRTRTCTDLTDEEKIRKSVDIKDRVKLLIQGSELSLQEHVKLAKDMHTTNFDHLYAHLRQHEAHANEVHLTRQRYPAQIALVANSPSCLNPTLYYPHMSPTTQQYYSPPTAPQHYFDAPMEPSNHSRWKSHRVDSSGETNTGYANTGARNNATNQGANMNVAVGQARVVKCYNYQEEDHFARQCTKPKRPKNSTWFKEKMLLTKALNSTSQEIPSPAAFQTNDLDSFDSDYDDAPSAKAVLMANLSSYDSNVILECFEQPSFDNEIEVDITSDSNIISYEQYLQETENPFVQDTSSPTQQDGLLMSVIEEMSSQVAKCNKVQHENKLVNETLIAELERYKEQVKIFEQRQKK